MRKPSARGHRIIQKLRHQVITFTALIGKPTGYNTFPAHKGFAIFDIVVHDIGGHSSDPSKGLSAIEKMGNVLRLIQEISNDLRKSTLPENERIFPEAPLFLFLSLSHIKTLGHHS